MYTMSQAVFGVGVGGEYPIASTSASERAEADESLHAKRGETVMLTFSMQGEHIIVLPLEQCQELCARVLKVVDWSKRFRDSSWIEC